MSGIMTQRAAKINPRRPRLSACRNPYRNPYRNPCRKTGDAAARPLYAVTMVEPVINGGNPHSGKGKSDELSPFVSEYSACADYRGARRALNSGRGNGRLVAKDRRPDPVGARRYGQISGCADRAAGYGEFLDCFTYGGQRGWDNTTCREIGRAMMCSTRCGLKRWSTNRWATASRFSSRMSTSSLPMCGTLTKKGATPAPVWPGVYAQDYDPADAAGVDLAYLAVVA